MIQAEHHSESERVKMASALEQAHLALHRGEVPVGAALFLGDELIAKAHNMPVSTHNPCAHAEVLVLQEAGRRLGNYRLSDCTLFVTLEPCVMCAGAILNARIKAVVFGAQDERAGAAGSVINVFANSTLNAHTQVQSGVMAQECAKLLVDFFKDRRAQAKALRAQSQQYLREDALRPEMHELNLLMRPWMQEGMRSVHVNDLSSFVGLRMHHWDTQAQALSASPHLAREAPRRTWVCLHGLGSSGAFFAPWAVERARLGERVLMPDLVGFGLSDHLRSPIRIDLETHLLVLQEWFERMNLSDVHLLSHDWSAQLALRLVPRLKSKVTVWLCLNPHLNVSASVLERHPPNTLWQSAASHLSQSKSGKQALLRVQPLLSQEQIAFMLSQLPARALPLQAQVFDQCVLKPSASSPLGLEQAESAFWSSPHAPRVLSACTRSLPWRGQGQEELHLLTQHLRHLESVNDSNLGDFWCAEVFSLLSQSVNASIG
jgi:tRNA(adenine34) deaminase